MNASRFICFMIFAVALVIAPVMADAAGVINLPKTGQTTSYYAGDDGAVQAGVDWPSTRFVDTGNGTMKDMLTGLEWLKTGNSGGAMTWENAAKYVDTLNAGTYSDWRMPNNNELASLLNYGTTNSAAWLNSQGFQDVQANLYWTSTTYLADLEDPTSQWFINMTNGGRNTDYKSWAASTNVVYVLPVRGGQTNSVDPAYPANIPKTGDNACAYRTGAGDWDWAYSDPCANNSLPGQDGQLKMGVAWPTNGNSPDGRFTVGAGTMLDNLTGLTWVGDAHSNSALTWTQALDSVANLNTTNYLGYNTWHLANINEMHSILNYDVLWSDVWNTPNLWKGHGQYLENQGFTNLKVNGGFYWTSTSLDASNAYQVHMGDDRERTAAKSTTAAWMAVSSPVVPEPVSSILFATGGAVFAGRNYLRKRRQKA